VRPRAASLVAALLGALVGLGAYTFRYAEGLSYFSTDPRACVNCHIMREPYDAWQKASHHAAATCVECHLPTAFVAKYLAKAENGFWHSKGFTLQDFAEPIRIKPRNRRLLQENCVRCHGELVSEIAAPHEREAAAVRCVTCHLQVGHGPAR
jgi:cytochrome c nitrite reductase small subunit